MKALLLIAALCSCYCSLASCIAPPAISKYIGAQFIAQVTVTKIRKALKDKSLFHLDIAVKDVYKGKPVRSVMIQGEMRNGSLKASEIDIEENMELLLYTYTNDGENHWLDLCSSFEISERTSATRLARELALLHALRTYDRKNPGVKWQAKSSFSTIDSLTNIHSDRIFGLFEVVLDSAYVVKSVSAINRFSKEIDDRVTRFLSQYQWQQPGRKSAPVSTDAFPVTMLVALFYYKDVNAATGFLGVYNL